MLASCSDFLEKEPDERVQIASAKQALDLLKTSYTQGNYGWVCEMSSDNVFDNNTPHKPHDRSSNAKSVRYSLSPYDRMDDELFRFEQVVSSSSSDSPESIWENYYGSTASANEVLASIERIRKERTDNDAARLKAAEAEAKLIRAYNGFILVNIFSQVYKNEELSANDKGVAYPTEPEDKVLVHYERPSVKATYDMIEQDLEDGLKGISDDYLEKPKWRFNENAAHAFAARYYLYKRNYDKVIEHANYVLGTDDATTQAKLFHYDGFNSNLYYLSDYTKVWQGADNPGNLMLIATYSLYQRHCYGARRYALTGPALTNTIYRTGPNWRWYFPPIFYASGIASNGDSDYGYYSTKIAEEFEYSDKVSGIGYVHTIRREFTTNALLLERAEAKLMKGDIEGCRNDLILFDNSRWTFSSDFQKQFFSQNALWYLTQKDIESYYSNMTNPNCMDKDTWNKYLSAISPDMKLPADEKAYIYMNCLNDMRRVETIQEGFRFFDLKRWGVEYSHVFDQDAKEIKLSSTDPRRAIEIPASVQAAGHETSRPSTNNTQTSAIKEFRIAE